MNVTTPAEISPEILDFCSKLVPDSAPQWIGHTAFSGAQISSCYENVEALIHNRGGSTLLGWIIWEWPGIVLEAEFHAVWQAPDGDLVDPTPKQDGERRILFLPQPGVVDEGGVVPSRYEALRDWEEVSQFVTVCQQNAERLRRHHEAYGDRPSTIPDENAHRRRQAAEAINRRLRRQGLTAAATLSEAEALDRHEASRADVEASIVLASHLASRGEFQRAFETLVSTSEGSQSRATQVRATMVSIFQACDDQRLVAEYQRRFSSLLF